MTERDGEACDYIVVGAGTAGCVVASRLTQSGTDKVLLLEAGGSDRRFWMRVPVGYGRTFGDPRVNWMYRTEPDPALAGTARLLAARQSARRIGLDQRDGVCPRSLLGLRRLAHARQSRLGLRRRAAVFQDGRGLLRHARRRKPGSRWTDPRQRHVEGRPSALRDIHRGVRERGLSAHRGLQLEGPRGVGIYKITTRNGIRESTARGYLHPALKRANLRIRLKSHALRILFDGNRAAGMAYLHRGATLEAHARKAVILCLGSINTPQLLQLSGVGDGALLQRHGIKVSVESPAVGRHLQDHLDLTFLYRSKVPTLNNDLYPPRASSRPASLSAHAPRPARHQHQPGRRLRAQRCRPAASQPAALLQPPELRERQWPIRRLMNPDPFPAFMVSFNICRPTSRGRVEIRSANPLDAPLIYPNSLSTEHDLARRSPECTCCASSVRARLSPASSSGKSPPVPRNSRTRSSCRTFANVHRPPSIRLALAGWGRTRPARSSMRGCVCTAYARSHRGCLDLSAHPHGQYQRTDHHGRREGLGPDRRG